jgi:hypothetical protein
MKRVRILQSVVSPQFEYQFGDEVEIDDRLAKSWIKAGVVELLTADSPALEYPSIHGTEFAAIERPALVTRG